MRSKAPLSLMEQMVMLLVFALAAALCLQAFVKSDQISRQSEARDRAAVLCQSTAEMIQYYGGEPEEALKAAAGAMDVAYGAYAGEGTAYEVHYNGDMTLCDTRDYAYCLRAEPMESGIPGLGKVRVWVVDTRDMEELFSLEVSWQKEVTAHG